MEGHIDDGHSGTNTQEDHLMELFAVCKENQTRLSREKKKTKKKTYRQKKQMQKSLLRHYLARSQILGHPQKNSHKRATTATKLSVVCPKTPSKVRVLGAKDPCAPRPRRRKNKNKTHTKKANTKHTETTTSRPAAETQEQVCYMPRYATLHHQKKPNDNHTHKDNQEV